MTYSKKLRIITKEVYIVLKKQAFMIIGMLLLTSLLVGCRMEMSRSEWCNRYGFAEDEVFDIEIGNYGFPYIDTEINGQQIKMMYDTGNMVGIFCYFGSRKTIRINQDRWNNANTCRHWWAFSREVKCFCKCKS